MKNILSSLNEGEKKRILEMYYTGSAKRYLTEQKVYKDGTYSYKVENNKYYYSTDDGKTWAEQTKPAGIQAIKDVIAKQGGTATTGATTKQGGTEKTNTEAPKTQTNERVVGLSDINRDISALNKWSMENPIKIDYDPAGVYVVNIKLLTRSIKEWSRIDSHKISTDFPYPYGVSITLKRSNAATANDKNYKTLNSADCFKTYTVDWKSNLSTPYATNTEKEITNTYNIWYKGNQGTTFCGYKEVTLTNTNGVSSPINEIKYLVASLSRAQIADDYGRTGNAGL